MDGPLPLGFRLARGAAAPPHRARLPPYDEIAARVAEEYAAQRRREANERAYREMRSRYDVIVEPAPQHPQHRHGGAVAVIRAVRGVALLVAPGALPAVAHRLSPAFFGLPETAPNVFAVQWKVSISGGLAAVLEPQIPDGCTVANGRAHLRARRRAISARDDRVCGRARRQGVHRERLAADADRRAAAHRLSRRQLVEPAPDSYCTRRHDPGAAERVRGRAHVHGARRRAHPARHRSLAVRARVAADRERRSAGSLRR